MGSVACPARARVRCQSKANNKSSFFFSHFSGEQSLKSTHGCNALKRPGAGLRCGYQAAYIQKGKSSIFTQALRYLLLFFFFSLSLFCFVVCWSLPFSFSHTCFASNPFSLCSPRILYPFPHFFPRFCMHNFFFCLSPSTFRSTAIAWMGELTIEKKQTCIMYFVLTAFARSRTENSSTR